MDPKVRNQIASSGDEAMKMKWDIVKKPQAGDVKPNLNSDGRNNAKVDKHLSTMLDKVGKRVDVEGGLKPGSKPLAGGIGTGKGNVETQRATREESKKQVTNYHDTRNVAADFSRLSRGTVQKADDNRGLSNNLNTNADAGNRAANTIIQKPGVIINPQNLAAGVNAALNGAKTPIEKGKPKVADNADPKPKKGADNNTTASEGKDAKVAKGADSAVADARVNLQAGQAGAIASGQYTENVEENKQLKIDSADNDREDEKETGDVSSTGRPGRLADASHRLEGISKGKRLDTGSHSKDDDFEVEAKGIDNVASNTIDDGMTDKGLGIQVMSEGNPDVVRNLFAAKTYNEKVVQLLKDYVPAEELVKNWAPDKELATRIVADTVEALNDARKMMNTLRTDPRGLGMIA